MQWLNMGGYWMYVWPCYLLTAAAMGLNIFLARSDFTAAVREARRRASAAQGDS